MVEKRLQEEERQKMQLNNESVIDGASLNRKKKINAKTPPSPTVK